jgi:endonuclease/exonuclease/phosphatase family metal-dependent hydrolase
MNVRPRAYKILSLNLAGYRGWLTREKPIIEYIETSKPDIILLQEVQFDLTTSPFDQATIVNNALAKPYKFCHSSISRVYVGSDSKTHREGLACMSRLPILHSEVLALNKKPDDKHLRIIQTITVEMRDLPLKIINVHFSNNSHSSEQLKEVYAIAEKYEQWPIISGDFNIFQLSDFKSLYEKEYIASTDFKSYISFPSQKLTLDYLLLPKTFRFQSIDTQDYLSDHTAMLYTVELMR